jgi:hypothetical protein
MRHYRVPLIVETNGFPWNWNLRETNRTAISVFRPRGAIMPYDRESAILTIAACAEGVLDDWGEVKGMDFSESVPAEEVEAIVAFMRADSVAASLALSSLGSHEADKHEHRPQLQNRDKAP